MKFSEYKRKHVSKWTLSKIISKNIENVSPLKIFFSRITIYDNRVIYIYIGKEKYSALVYELKQCIDDYYGEERHSDSTIHVANRWDLQYPEKIITSIDIYY